MGLVFIRTGVSKHGFERGVVGSMVKYGFLNDRCKICLDTPTLKTTTYKKHTLLYNGLSVLFRRLYGVDGGGIPREGSLKV